MYISSFIMLISGIFLTSCEENAPVTDDVLIPQINNVEILKDEENPNSITVTVDADNANFYRFKNGYNDEVDENQQGNFTYTYPEAGTYQITVQAHATADAYTQNSQNVLIEKPTIDSTDNFTDEGYVSPDSYEGYSLVWEDEFTGSSLSDNYTFEIGTGSNGWGNNESQYYRKENTTVADGYLMIEAREESFGGRNYTSSRIITEGKKFFRYGRIDIRAKMPGGQGIWPALWMLGENFREVGWPHCGEIDIMEMIGGQNREKTVHGTVHWQSDNGYASYTGSKTLQNESLADKFHVFSIIWNEQSITWFIDNEQYHTIDLSPAHLSEFKDEFFFIFNIAVGGNWPGYPDQTTTFPQRMYIDYVRVFQTN